MNSQKLLDTSKLLGFDTAGQPIFDIVESTTAVGTKAVGIKPAGAVKSLGSSKNTGVGKVPGNIKT
jgi:hypothetical protein